MVEGSILHEEFDSRHHVTLLNLNIQEDYHGHNFIQQQIFTAHYELHIESPTMP
jgi:hypothetical protein